MPYSIAIKTYPVWPSSRPVSYCNTDSSVQVILPPIRSSRVRRNVAGTDNQESCHHAHTIEVTSITVRREKITEQAASSIHVIGSTNKYLLFLVDFAFGSRSDLVITNSKYLWVMLACLVSEIFSYWNGEKEICMREILSWAWNPVRSLVEQGASQRTERHLSQKKLLE